MRPVTLSISADCTPGGGTHGTPPVLNPACTTICAQIGAARDPPAAPGVIVRGRSKPIHTPATRSCVIPTNQTSVLSFVVPVFPATGTDAGMAFRTEVAVP